jgi:hypothetical protein
VRMAAAQHLLRDDALDYATVNRSSEHRS